MVTEIGSAQNKVANTGQVAQMNEAFSHDETLSEKVKQQMRDVINSQPQDAWDFEIPEGVNIEVSRKGPFGGLQTDYLGEKDGWEIAAFVPVKGKDIGTFYAARKKGRMAAQWILKPFPTPQSQRPEFTEDVKQRIFDTIQSSEQGWSSEKPERVEAGKGFLVPLGEHDGYSIRAFIPEGTADIGKFYPVRAIGRMRPEWQKEPILIPWLPTSRPIPRFPTPKPDGFEAATSTLLKVAESLKDTANTLHEKATDALSEGLQNAVEAIHSVSNTPEISKRKQATVALRDSIQEVIDRPGRIFLPEHNLNPKKDIQLMGDSITVTFPRDKQFLSAEFKKVVQSHFDRIDETRIEQGKEPFGNIPFQILFYK